MNSQKELFSKEDISQFFRNLREMVVTKIHDMTARELAPEQIPTLEQRFVDNHSFEPIYLDTDNKAVHPPKEGETTVPDNFRSFRRVKGMVVDLDITFTGTKLLFDLRPSHWTTSTQPADKYLYDDHITIRLHLQGQSADQLRGKFEQEIDILRKNIIEQRGIIADHNARLREEVTKAIQDRREKLHATDKLVFDIGYPVKRRDEPLNTRILPITRKPVSLPPAAAPAKVSAASKTILDNRIYEDILGTLSGMSVAIERSPKAFAGMQEETLRTWFLVALNGVYQGAATAETFNMEGKADITIRHNGDILFIAECKFWSGPKGLGEAIDQLLGYLTCREQRGTILLFNRNRDFSAVLEQIPGVVSGRTDFIRHETAPPLPSAFRFALRSKADPDAEVVITLLAFAVPHM